MSRDSSASADQTAVGVLPYCEWNEAGRGHSKRVREFEVVADLAKGFLQLERRERYEMVPMDILLGGLRF